MVKYEDGHLAHEKFSYSSVVVILLYLTDHMRPNISHAVNCCDRHIFLPKHFHELALNHIGHYLKSKITKGLVLNISLLMCKIFCFRYYEFSGMYDHESPTNP